MMVCGLEYLKYSNNPKGLVYNGMTRANISSLWLWCAIIIYSIVIGCREDVGIDFENYKRWYLVGDYNIQMETEWLKTILRFFNLNYKSFFIVIASLQIGFFIFSVTRRKEILMWSIFFYFTTLQFFLSMNVMRQALAWCIFLYSIRFISSSKLLYYAIAVFFASLFHSSAIILLPFYFLKNIKTFPPFLYIAVYVLLYFIGSLFKETISIWLAIIAGFIGYTGYAENMEQFMESINFGPENSLGIASLFWLIINLLSIYYIKRIELKYPHKELNLIFLLFFIGICLDSIVAGSILERASMYFLPFRIIIYSYLFKFLLSKRELGLKIYVSFSCLFLIIFYYSGILGDASGCYPFKF